MQKERFKIFVRNNPHLISYVENGKMTWQKFYELYDLYGEDNDIWNNYAVNDSNKSGINVDNNQGNNVVGTIKDILGLFKGVDLWTVQKTLGSLEKAIGTFKDFNSNNNRSGEVTNSNYEERPMYKYFED